MSGFCSGEAKEFGLLFRFQFIIRREEGQKRGKKGGVMAQSVESLTQARDDSDLHFGPFRLEKTKRLWRGERLLNVRPRPLAVLHYLAERPGRLVPKEELLKQL